MAANSILKLKVESEEYDAKLKKAAEGIRHLAEVAHRGGGELTGLEKAELDYVKALGSMETKSRTASGSVRELESTFKELTVVYNHLNDVEKQDEGGKALRASLDQIKQRAQEARAELDEASKSLQGAENSMKGANDGSLLSKLGSKMDGALAVFGGNLMTKAAGMGVGLVTEMTDAVKQGIELAKAGEGVRIAFERLGRGDILQGLREATHGTVTDLELMKAAVKFNDFKLPVEELGTMLAFAQQKAKDTGQSVDYMVDSIVTGLGRKSLMILDNLGLSASEIKEKMAETGDMTKAVGEIIREQMSKAGDYVETAADRAAQANVSLQNKMEELGRKFAPLEEASNNFWTSMKIGILDVVGGPLATLLNKLTEAGRLMNAYGQMGGSGKVGRMTSNLAGAREGNRQSIYQQQQERFWRYINPREQQIKDIRAWQRGERGEALQKRIGAITDKYGSLDITKIQAEVDAAKKMLSEYQQAAKQILNPVKVDIDTKGAEQNVESLKVKLIELEAQRKKAIAAGDTDLSKSLAKQITQVKSDIKGLGGSTTIKGRSSRKVTPLAEKLLQSFNKANGKIDASSLMDTTTAGGSALFQMLQSAHQKEIGNIKLDSRADFEAGRARAREQIENMEDPIKYAKKQLAKMDAIAGNIGNILSGLTKMGIELPEGLSAIVEGTQSMISIVSSILTLVTLISTVQSVKSIPIIGWALANGGIIGGARGRRPIHAATGTIVPGNNYSGDRVPALVNSGELILNRAQQGNIASQLQGGGMQNMNLQAIVTGEQLRFVLNTNSRRRGKGEYVTSTHQ